jgi:hypothetical protein
MFEANVNTIVDQTNDQLDMLKVYITYRTTYFVERVLNRIKVMESLGSGWEFDDSEPMKFSMLQKTYDAWKHDKTPIIAATQMAIKELDADIYKLIYKNKL